MKNVSWKFLKLMKRYGEKHNNISMHCACGTCLESWFERGWVCQDLVHHLSWYVQEEGLINYLLNYSWDEDEEGLEGMRTRRGYLLH